MAMNKLRTRNGDPFVTAPGGKDAIEREPRVKSVDD